MLHVKINYLIVKSKYICIYKFIKMVYCFIFVHMKNTPKVHSRMMVSKEVFIIFPSLLWTQDFSVTFVAGQVIPVPACPNTLTILD